MKTGYATCAVVPLMLACAGRAMAIAEPVIGSASGGPTPNATLSIVVDEAAGTVSVNGAITQPIGNGPDGVPLYSTGGNFVQAGDIYFFEPPTPGDVSDMIRIYAAASTYGDTFSVWSDSEAGEVEAPDPFDHPFPANVPNANSVGVFETQIYRTADLDPAQTSGTYQFKSDTDVPEPAALGIVAFGALGLLRRRR